MIKTMTRLSLLPILLAITAILGCNPTQPPMATNAQQQPHAVVPAQEQQPNSEAVNTVNRLARNGSSNSETSTPPPVLTEPESTKPNSVKRFVRTRLDDGGFPATIQVFEAEAFLATQELYAQPCGVGYQNIYRGKIHTPWHPEPISVISATYGKTTQASSDGHILYGLVLNDQVLFQRKTHVHRQLKRMPPDPAIDHNNAVHAEDDITQLQIESQPAVPGDG